MHAVKKYAVLFLAGGVCGYVSARIIHKDRFEIDIRAYESKFLSRNTSLNNSMDRTESAPSQSYIIPHLSHTVSQVDSQFTFSPEGRYCNSYFAKDSELRYTIPLPKSE